MSQLNAKSAPYPINPLDLSQDNILKEALMNS